MSALLKPASPLTQLRDCLAAAEHEAVMAALSASYREGARALAALENLGGMTAHDKSVQLAQVLADLEDIEDGMRGWDGSDIGTTS